MSHDEVMRDGTRVVGAIRGGVVGTRGRRGFHWTDCPPTCRALDVRMHQINRGGRTCPTTFPVSRKPKHEINIDGPDRLCWSRQGGHGRLQCGDHVRAAMTREKGDNNVEGRRRRRALGSWWPPTARATTPKSGTMAMDVGGSRDVDERETWDVGKKYAITVC
jgi:hypothetical protein